MRVLDLNTLYIDGGEGGVNTYLREKARCLDGAVCPSTGARVHHTIVVPGARDSRTTFGGSTLYTLRSPRLPGNRQHRLLVDFPRVARLLRDERPDLIEVDCSYILGHVAARAVRPRRVPIVGFYHVHLPLLYTRAGLGWVRRRLSSRTEPLAWGYVRLCARPCSRVIVTTRDMRARLEGRRLPRLEVVPLGVNLDLFRPREHGRRPPVRGVDPSRPVVLYVGRLSREKDLDVLYSAHAELERECGAQLVLAGDGPLAGQARRLSRVRPGVVWLGTCPYGEDLAELYRAADVLAVPGRNETFGLIVLEAFASGLPVVAVNQGGPSELCRPGLGALARPGDAGDFAAKLRAALGARAAGSVFRRHVEPAYSWERTFARLLDVYESLRGAQEGGGADRRAEPVAARGA